MRHRPEVFVRIVEGTEDLVDDTIHVGRDPQAARVLLEEVVFDATVLNDPVGKRLEFSRVRNGEDPLLRRQHCRATALIVRGGFFRGLFNLLVGDPWLKKSKTEVVAERGSGELPEVCVLIPRPVGHARIGRAVAVPLIPPVDECLLRRRGRGVEFRHIRNELFADPVGIVALIHALQVRLGPIKKFLELDLEILNAPGFSCRIPRVDAPHETPDPISLSRRNHRLNLLESRGIFRDREDRFSPSLSATPHPGDPDLDHGRGEPLRIDGLATGEALPRASQGGDEATPGTLDGRIGMIPGGHPPDCFEGPDASLLEGIALGVVSLLDRRSAAEFKALTEEIHRLIAEAVRQGIQPTEVWLGSRELEIFDAANTTTEANCYTSKVRTFANLAVKRSFENGVRVGATVASPTSSDC